MSTDHIPDRHRTAVAFVDDGYVNIIGWHAHDTTARFALARHWEGKHPVELCDTATWQTAYRLLFPLIHGDPSDVLRSALPDHANREADA